jgi:hypothetical protein
MILLNTLKYLSTQKAKDAHVLFEKGRYNGAVYLMGYALEMKLKRKLSLTLGFSNGFPESNGELNAYYSAQLAAFNTISTGITLAQIRQIRNHKLRELIKFSGAEPRIVGSFFAEWALVCNWDPETRYLRQNWNLTRTTKFMNAAEVILKQIS